MPSPKTDRERRFGALARLAAATREKVEKETYAVYLDDTKHIAVDVLELAAHRLEKSSTWFPKVAELIAMCNVVLTEQRVRREQQQPRLAPTDTPSPERMAELMAKIRAACQGKRF